jgi:hypothetical protein
MIDWALEDVNYAYHEHMPLATKYFWTGRNKNFKSRDNSRGAPRPSGPKVRNFYNYGDKNHFIAECPYEKREENGGWLVSKDRSKYSPNKYFLNKSNSNKKKVPTRVLVFHEEYESRGDDDHDNESSEEAGVAIIATTSTPSISLFGATNENLSTAKHKCLMVKATEVSPKPITKPFTPTSHDANILKVNMEVVALDEFLTNMHGDTKKHFEALMSQLREAQELLEEKEAHEHEVTDEIMALAQTLEKDQGLRAPLEDSLVVLEESHNLNISKHTKDRDHALTLATYWRKVKRVLKSEKSEFDIGHARLIGDLEKLEEAHKVLESKISSLNKSYEQLQTQLTMKILEVHVSSSSNPFCDHEKLVPGKCKVQSST